MFPWGMEKRTLLINVLSLVYFLHPLSTSGDITRDVNKGGVARRKLILQYNTIQYKTFNIPLTFIVLEVNGSLLVTRSLLHHLPLSKAVSIRIKEARLKKADY
eukprot:sb/3478227/